MDSLRAGFLVVVLGVAIRAANFFGVERTLRFGAGLGRTWHRIRGPRTRRVDEQLAAAFPEMTAAARVLLARDVFTHLGQGLFELLLLLGRHRQTMLDSIEVEGLEHLHAATAAHGGKGAIVIGPHLGNWELGAAKLAALGIPVSAVYRGRRQPALERAIVAIRAGRDTDLEPGGEPIQQIAMGRRAGVQFLRAIERGRHVLVLLDQHARGDDGRVVDFFGRPARTRFGPLKLADRANAPVLLAFARRDADGRHHRLTLHPPLQLEPGASDDEDVLRRNLQQVTSALETEIRATPDQWIWTHRRWRAPVTSDSAEETIRR